MDRQRFEFGYRCLSAFISRGGEKLKSNSLTPLGRSRVPVRLRGPPIQFGSVQSVVKLRGCSREEFHENSDAETIGRKDPLHVGLQAIGQMWRRRAGSSTRYVHRATGEVKGNADVQGDAALIWQVGDPPYFDQQQNRILPPRPGASTGEPTLRVLAPG